MDVQYFFLYCKTLNLSSVVPVQNIQSEREESLISISILLACALFHPLQMSLCARRGRGPTTGNRMFQSPSQFLLVLTKRGLN